MSVFIISGEIFTYHFVAVKKRFLIFAKPFAPQMQKKPYPVKDPVTNVKVRNAIKYFYLFVLWMERDFSLINVMQYVQE